MAARPALAAYEDRVEQRDETYHRTRVRDASGGEHFVTLVNASPHGFMARCEADIPVGAILSVNLPVVGAFEAEVRWSLGGRIGCRLLAAMPPSLYQFALAAMR